MPIKSFENPTFEDNPFGGLPRIAKWHKGSKKRTRTKNGRTYEIVGEDLDYFRIEFKPEYEYLRPLWEGMYGTKPTSLQVMFNAETVAQALDYWKEDWTASTLLHRCDEKHQHVWYDGKFYQRARIGCVAPACACKPVARLNFIVAEFTLKTGVLGYMTIETTSQEDIRTLIARLSSFWATFGRLRGIPFILYRQQRDVSAPEMTKDGKERTGKRLKLKRSMLDIQVEPEYSQKFLLEALTGERPALPAPAAAHAPDAVPDVEQSKKSLGSGGNRRIGAESAQKPANGSGSQSPSRWVEDVKRVADFKKWALDTFKLDEQKVVAALDNAFDEDAVKGVADWKYDERTAVAAVVAYFCDYSAPLIEETTVMRKLSVEVHDIALTIAQSMVSDEAAENGEAAPDEALEFPE